MANMWASYPVDFVPELTVDIYLEFRVATGGAVSFLIDNKTAPASVIINWGDGSAEQSIVVPASGTAATKTYATTGSYVVRVYSYDQSVNRVRVQSTTSLIGIQKYWSTVITSMESVFDGAANVEYVQAEFNTADLPLVTSYRYCFRGWTNFNSQLPTDFMRYTENVTDFSAAFYNWNSYSLQMPPWFMNNTQSAILISEMFHSWTAFNSDVPWDFMIHLENVTNASQTFYGWQVFNQPLPDAFFTNLPALITSQYTFYGWFDFNQPLPVGFYSKTPVINDISSIFARWQSYDQPFPAGFMGNLETLTIASNAFTQWRAFNSAINEEFFSNIPVLRNVQQLFWTWRLFNKPLPANFFADTPELANIQQMMTEWLAYNQPLPERFFANAPLAGTSGASFALQFMDEWNAFDQPLPTTFLQGTNQCRGWNGAFSNWTSYTHALFIPDVTGSTAAPTVVGMYANNSLAVGSGMDLINQRTDWTLSGTPTFQNCTSLDDYDELPTGWK